MDKCPSLGTDVLTQETHELVCLSALVMDWGFRPEQKVGFDEFSVYLLAQLVKNPPAIWETWV